MITYICIIYMSLTIFQFIHYNNINAFLITKSLLLKYPNLPIIKGIHHNFMMIEDNIRIKPTGIEVYSTTGCKYCRIAKAKLIELGLDFKNYDIHNNIDNESKLELHDSYVNSRIEYARQRKVPQIYVHEEHIGGCNELLQDIKDGIFQQRLARYNISSMNVKSHHVAVNVTSLQYNNFAVIDDQPLNSVTYRSMISATTTATSSGTTSTAPISQRHSAIALSSLLQQTALKLLDTFVWMDGKKINYKQMRNSIEFEQYLYLSTLLADCSILELQLFSDVEKLIFYSNLYNAMIVHSNCVLSSSKSLESSASFSDLRSPEAIAQRSAFFSGRTGAIYRIGPYIFSPDDIEHGILRCNIPHPSQITTANLKQLPNPLTYFSIDDPRAVLSISRNSFDPRIHFLLNCGALSCPPIKVLDINNYQTAISLATSTYLLDEIKIQQQNSTIITSTSNAIGGGGGDGTHAPHNNVIYLPRLLLWYADDFGTNIIYILHTILSYLVPHTLHTIVVVSPIYQQLHDILYNPTEEVRFILTTTDSTGREDMIKLLPLNNNTNNSNVVQQSTALPPATTKDVSPSLVTRIIEYTLGTCYNNSNTNNVNDNANIKSIDDDGAVRHTYKIEYNLYDWTFNSV